MGGLFSSSALDKATLDLVQKQLVDNGVDVGERVLECSLIDNDRGGTFYVKFERRETVMRVWDAHCSWWEFDFKRQGEREITALQLAKKTDLLCPQVLASGEVNMAQKMRHYMVTQFYSEAREDDWEEREPPERFAGVAVRILKALSSNTNLTPETLAGQGFLRDGQSINDFPLPYYPEHHDILRYLQTKATEVDDKIAAAAVEKTAALFRDIEPLACGPCLVHSDLHPGNVLLDKDFQLLAVVDWEEAAISDLRVDVAQACLACDNRELIWTRFQEETGMQLGDMGPWLVLVALMRFMVGVQIEWYEDQGRDVPDKNLSGWESLCGDAEELLISYGVLPNPSSPDNA